jgi:hypothetical protein
MKRSLALTTLIVLMCLTGHGLPQARQAPDLSMNVLYLDGKSGYVTLPAGVFDGLAEVTVEAWVRWERFARWGQVFDFGREGNAILVQNEEASSTIQFVIYDDRGKAHRVKAEKAISPGVWYHLAAVCGSGGMRFYIDGKLVDKDRYEGGLDRISGENHFIGRSNWPRDELFQGHVAEFRVWSRALPREEMAARKDRLLTGREPGLAACWRFNRAQGGSVPDDGPSGKPATLAEGARIVSVPAIDRYLVPGELEKAAADVYASGMAGMRSGAYITAYRDFRAAFDLVPGFRDADSLMRVAVEKGRYRLAVLPVAARSRVETPGPGKLRRVWEAMKESGTVDLLREEEEGATLLERLNETLRSALLRDLPPYVAPVAGNPLDWDLKGRGLDARTADPERVIRALKASGVEMAVFGEVEVASLRHDTRREARKAFRVREVTYLDKQGKERRKKEKAGEHTYYVITRDARVECRVRYRLVNVRTGAVLKEDAVEEEIRDRVEYADPNGVRREELYVENYGDLRRLDGEDKRFGAREKLRDRIEMTGETAAAAGKGMAEGLRFFVNGYSPGARAEGEPVPVGGR